MDLRRVSQMHFCSLIWDIFKEKLYYSNGFLNWRIFSLPFLGWSSDIHLPRNSTSCDDSIENLWQFKFCCLKWPPGLYQFSDFISCSHADSSEHAGKTFSLVGQCSQPRGTSPGNFYFQWIFRGIEFLQKEQIWHHLFKKKVSNNFILPGNSVPSTVCSPDVIMLILV